MEKRKRKWKTRAEYEKGRHVTWHEELLHLKLGSLSYVPRLVINQKVRRDHPLNISGLDQYSTDNSLKILENRIQDYTKFEKKLTL